ncbi:MAG: prolipoprotein diacylglyceryl transferase, partial [Clostridia bacterium]|nr:prolipoprotein diacylglyceryl transferase [Clostridia bacterium]MBQ8572606.1 prolipoprotein diacylglyceryl transferase [Ruminococcus sp.]
MQVTFPKLGLEFFVNSTAFSIGSFEVKWYGIIIALGLLLAVFYAMKRAPYFGLDTDKLMDAVIVGVICAV